MRGNTNPVNVTEMQQLAYKFHNKTRQFYIYVGLKNHVATDVIHVLCVCRHLLRKCEITVGVLCFFMLQCLPGSPGQKFRFHDGQLVLLGVKQTPPPFQSPGIGGGLLRSLRLASGGVSCWLLLQDGPLMPWWWESAPPLWGLTPLGGGGESVSGPAWRGSAVGWAGWSQEAGVQGWSHWRARQVLGQRDVRQTCFCSVIYCIYYSVIAIFPKKESEKSHHWIEHSLIGPRSCDPNAQADELQHGVIPNARLSLKCCRSFLENPTGTSRPWS